MVVLTAGCGGGAVSGAGTGRSREAGSSPLEITGRTRLLDLLDRAVWAPSLVNLNNPVIAAVQADLGDGPVPALYAHPPASLTWSLELLRPMNLVTAVGLRRAAWEKSSDGVGFQILIEDGRLHTLFQGRVDPRHHAGQRGWQPLVLDLSPWTGRAVRLILKTDPGPHQEPGYDWSVFKDPQLTPR
ncbi:MAG: hypothetical protein ACE5ID_03210 [Acidobacteriota bacterium]